MTALPPWYFCRPSRVALQPLSSESVTVRSVFFPFAVSVTVMPWGRLPSWLLSSAQTFLTEAEVVSGVCVLVRVVVSPSTEVESW